MKVLDWNSIRVNQNYSDSFRYLYPRQCESFRTNPNESEPIWNQVCKPDQSESIRMNPGLEWFWLIRIGFSEFIELDRIDFWLFFVKRDTKRFSDWFGMIRIGSDTDIGMNRNSSDRLGINFSPVLLLGRKRYSPQRAIRSKGTSGSHLLTDIS